MKSGERSPKASVQAYGGSSLMEPRAQQREGWMAVESRRVCGMWEAEKGVFGGGKRKDAGIGKERLVAVRMPQCLLLWL